MREAQLEHLELKGLIDLEGDKLKSYYGIGLIERGTVFLSSLEKNGIKCFGMHVLEGEKTEYAERFRHEMNRRLDTYAQTASEQ